MDLTALKTFNGTKSEGLVRTGKRMLNVDTDRAKELVRLGLASQYEVKPVEVPETKAEAAAHAKADKAAAEEKAKEAAAGEPTKSPAKK